MKVIILFLAAAVFCANPLANLPSAPGSTVAQIQAMGDHSWLNLGSPAADAAWGRARGRSYSPRMVYCPDKEGIFLCATGQHGYVKTGGYYMDDLWFYDINTHQWICLYPGAGTPSSATPLNLHLDSNGLEVDSLGNHIPVSYLSHGYCNITYNPDSCFYTIMWTQCPWWCNALPQRVAWLGNDSCGYGNVGPQIGQPKHVLYWDVKQGKWMRRFHAGAGPSSRAEGVAEYLPTMKKLFYKWGTQTWMYDYSANLWTRSTANFPDASYDYHGCYDSRRGRVYVAKGTGFWYYDVQGNAWTTVSAANQPNVGASTSGCFQYDSANDAIIAFVIGAGVFAYDIDANAWSQVDTIISHSGSCHNGAYDPDLNAHFIFAAGDSYDNGTMLVYRYKKAPSAVRKNRPRAEVPGLEANPNPFRSSVMISTHPASAVKVFDMRGKAVASFQGRGKILWDAGGMPSGTYVIMAETAGKKYFKTIALIR